MHINEENGIRKRYEATAALRDDIQYAEVVLTESSDSGFTATFGSGEKS